MERLGRSAVSVHDPIKVRALYLEDGDIRIALVSVDVHSITPELRARVLELAPAVIQENHIILTATHTHSGPGGLSKDWFARRYLGRYSDETLTSIAQNIADAIDGAMQTMKRATIGYKVSSQEVLTQNLFSPEGPRSAQIGVIRVDDSDGNPIAILGSMAAHPTTAPASDLRTMSADFPGYFCDHLESISHEDTVAFFLNGAVGDQVCTNHENKSGWDWTQYIGQELAIVAKSISNTIECREHPITMNYATGTVPNNLAETFLPRSVLFQTLEIDRLLVSFIPGEPYNEVHTNLDRSAKRRGYDAYMTVGLANDYVMDIASSVPSGARGSAPGLDILGPFGGSWSIDIIHSLMRLGDITIPVESATEDVPFEAIPGGYRVGLHGDAQTRMHQQGTATGYLMEKSWGELVLSGVRDGDIAVDLPLWKKQSGIDPTPIALPILAERERKRLTANEVERIGWFAQAAHEPFDSVQLLQRYTYENSVPTVIAVTGERAGEDGQLIGYLAAAPPETPIVVFQHQPLSGRRFLQIGMPWETSFRVGMNDAGLAISTLAGQVSMGFADVVEELSTLESAISAITEREVVGNRRVLIADRPIGDARLLIRGSEWSEQLLEDKVVIQTSKDLTISEPSVMFLNRADIETLLKELAAQRLAQSASDTPPTVFAVILELNTKIAYLAVSEGDSFPEQFDAYSVTEATP